MNESRRRPRVAVVFGGKSSEHAISCVTAGSVLAAIDRAAYDVVPIGIATDGRWVLESGDPELLRIEGPDRLPAVDGDRAANALASGKTAAAFGELFNSAYWASRPYRGIESHLSDPCEALAEYLAEAYLQLAENARDGGMLSSLQELAKLAVYRLGILTSRPADRNAPEA